MSDRALEAVFRPFEAEVSSVMRASRHFHRSRNSAPVILASAKRYARCERAQRNAMRARFSLEFVGPAGEHLWRTAAGEGRVSRLLSRSAQAQGCKRLIRPAHGGSYGARRAGISAPWSSKSPSGGQMTGTFTSETGTRCERSLVTRPASLAARW